MLEVLKTEEFTLWKIKSDFMKKKNVLYISIRMTIINNLLALYFTIRKKIFFSQITFVSVNAGIIPTTKTFRSKATDSVCSFFYFGKRRFATQWFVRNSKSTAWGALKKIYIHSSLSSI